MPIPVGRLRYDLHLHSTRSDGAFEPDEVLRRCAAGKLDVVALTDHDLTDALKPGPRTIDGRTIHVIGGAEVSGVLAGREQHLLVYFADAVPEGFIAFCKARSQSRAVRYANAVDRLGLHGLDGPCDAAKRGDRALTRHHLARALVEAGHAHDMRDAFRKYVDPGQGNVPLVDLDFVEAIRVARSYGGVTSWAHPAIAALKLHLADLATVGLHAVEGIRPGTSNDERRKIKHLARKHGLVVTGGSDWHGWHDGDLGMFAVEVDQIRDFLGLFEAVQPQSVAA